MNDTFLKESQNETSPEKLYSGLLPHEEIHELNVLLHKKDTTISLLKKDLADKEFTIAHLNNIINDIYASKRWRICFPLSWLRKIIPIYIKILTEAISILAEWTKIKKATIVFFTWLEQNTIFVLNRKNLEKMTSQLFLQLFEHTSNERREHVAFSLNPKVKTDIKIIAFYLPQFHPIKENNDWWGKGFTEWTNVTKAVPQFIGHYQPRLPGELGFYDLRLVEVQKRQIELAKNYGIHGFCYHHYWFSGRKLLSAPFQQVLANPELDLPFCLCWANENWTRKWDGLEKEVLLAQNHSPEDDLAFIKDIEAALRDPRYIRINGRPLLMVYNISLMPNPSATAKRWREYCISSGIGDLYLTAAQYVTVHDLPEGFDALVEFPPHHLALGAPSISAKAQMVNPKYKGNMVDYNYIVEKANSIKNPLFKLIRTTFPSWDNEARAPGGGYTFLNSTPTLYKKWLKNSIAYTRKYNDEKIMFVNAWNEWAEGAYLEPDRRYGYAWLQATYEALIESNLSNERKLILVSHDAYPFGAQHLMLKLAQTLALDFGFQIDLVLLGEGDLFSEFEKISTVHSLANQDHQGDKAFALAQQLFSQGHTTAIINTTVCGLFLETLKKTGIHCVALVHELPGAIEEYAIQNAGHSISQYADTVIFPATMVEVAFCEKIPVAQNKIIIRPQGLIKKNTLQGMKEKARQQLRQKLNLSEEAQIVLGMGYGHPRKGTDLFVEIGLNVLKTHPRAHFIWVGPIIVPAIEEFIAKGLENEPMASHFIFTGYEEDTDLYFAGADIFALTSREDPFPSVVLHSLEVAVPVIGFNGAGGFAALLEKGCGILVPKEEVSPFSGAIADLLDHPEKSKQLGATGAALIEKDFSFSQYVFDLLKYSHIGIKRVTAIVPNYNYARHLEERLSSIFNQRYPLFEIIILDDASTDNSIEVINDCLLKTHIDHRVIKNDKNSGSVFSQWQKGINLARGDFIWICEADDASDFTFLESALTAFDDETVAMSYTQSRQINECGDILANDYLEYTNDISTTKWTQNYICDGNIELSEALSIKNTIPNVSAIVFRKSNLQEAIKCCQAELNHLVVAGDWLVYAEVLKTGKIAFTSQSLNSHRRHSNTVTTGTPSIEHVADVIFMQKRVAKMIASDLLPGLLIDEKAKIYIDKLNVHFSLPTDDAVISQKIDEAVQKRFSVSTE